MKNKNKLSLSLFSLLLIKMIVFNNLVFSKEKAPQKPLQTSQQPVRENFKFLLLKRSAFDKGWGRNPFFGPSRPSPPPKYTVQKKDTLPQLKLEMIFEVNGKKRAILSGKLLKEGDYMGKERVVKIEREGVMLEKSGKQRMIKLDPFLNSFQVEEKK